MGEVSAIEIAKVVAATLGPFSILIVAGGALLRWAIDRDTRKLEGRIDLIESRVTGLNEKHGEEAARLSNLIAEREAERKQEELRQATREVLPDVLKELVSNGS